MSIQCVSILRNDIISSSISRVIIDRVFLHENFIFKNCILDKNCKFMSKANLKTLAINTS